MTVTPIRPNMNDSSEPPKELEGDLIIIHVHEGQVDIRSSLKDEKTVFYIDLCKHIIMKDWFGEYYDND